MRRAVRPAGKLRRAAEVKNRLLRVADGPAAIVLVEGGEGFMLHGLLGHGISGSGARALQREQRYGELTAHMWEVSCAMQHRTQATCWHLLVRCRAFALPAPGIENIN